jgi:hypothetical protein
VPENWKKKSVSNERQGWIAATQNRAKQLTAATKLDRMAQSQQQ